MLNAVSPPRGGARAIARVFLLVSALVAALPLAAADPPLELEVQPAPLAANIQPRGVIGKLRFLGMLSIAPISIAGLRLSQLSDIAWDDNAGILYAISDKGILFHLQPVFREDVLTGLRLLRAAPLRELKTAKPTRDRRIDAEGLDLLRDNDRHGKDARLIVSFERYPRILRYRTDGTAVEEYALPQALADREAYVQPNRMLEAVCHDPRFGILTMPEKPLEHEASGYNRLYSLSGESWRYPIAEEDRVVGLSCLGNGEVLVLEGNFGTRFWRSHATLKRVRVPDATGRDAPLQPQTLFTLESRKGYQIDNFEGIARHRGNRFFLVSDDNDFFLQRTLLLYFELLDE